MNKGISALLITIGLSISLAACDSTGSAPPPDISSDVPAAATQPIVTATTADAQEITLTFDSWDIDTNELKTVERVGTYTGPLVDGVPNGVGKFESTNSTGEPWYYEGDFKDGRFEGQGTTKWSGTEYFESGTYVNGIFTPTVSELFVAYSQLESVPYNISSKSASMLEDNFKIFPCNSAEDIAKAKALVNADLEYRQLNKNVSTYYNDLYLIENATAAQVFETQAWGHTITQILVSDSDENCSIIYYDGALPDIFDLDVLNIYGLPVDISSFKNISGGSTNVIVLIGSIVEKV